VDDAAMIVRAVRARWDGPVVLLGLCASAWVALQMVLREPVDGVIALNPQLYWKPGDPVEATMAETRLRRTSARAREARGRRYGVWSALDRLGQRPWAGRWLDGLAASGVPVTLVFAAGDDGLEYLRDRLARRLRSALRPGLIRVVEIPDIDHSMSRAWLRGRVVAVLGEELRRICGESA
jgi:dienelactone hydrolase